MPKVSFYPKTIIIPSTGSKKCSKASSNPPHPLNSDLYDHAWNRVRDHSGSTTLGVGMNEARYWHRRAYGGLVRFTSPFHRAPTQCRIGRPHSDESPGLGPCSSLRGLPVVD